jgi:hypothetical protein
MPWEINEGGLIPIAYDYRTGSALRPKPIERSEASRNSKLEAHFRSSQVISRRGYPASSNPGGGTAGGTGQGAQVGDGI